MPVFRVLLRYIGRRASYLRSTCVNTINNNANSKPKMRMDATLNRLHPAVMFHTSIRTTTNINGKPLLSNSSGKLKTAKCNYCTEVTDDINIDYEKMETLIKEGNTFIIDVREEEEIEAFGAIPDAVNIPMGDLVQALELSPRQYKSMYNSEQPDPDNSHIIFVCAKGFRSYAAVMLARELDYKKSCHLEGGYEHWKQCQDREGS